MKVGIPGRAWLQAAGLLALTLTPARADLWVFEAERAEPVCRLAGAIRGAWWVDAEHLAVAWRDQPRVVRLRDCQPVRPLAPFVTGESPQDLGRPWVLDGDTVRDRATGALRVEVRGQLVLAPGAEADPQARPSDARCAPGAAPRPEACEVTELHWLAEDGGLFAGHLLGPAQVRAWYPAEGEVGVGGLTFLRDGEGWLLAAPARGRMAIPLYRVPSGELHDTLVVPEVPGLAPGWRTCETPSADDSGSLVAASCNVGAVVWDRIRGRAQVLPAPPGVEALASAVVALPRGDTVLVAFEDRVAAWHAQRGWGPVVRVPGADVRRIVPTPAGDGLWLVDAEQDARRIRWPGGQPWPTGSGSARAPAAVSFGPPGHVAWGFGSSPQPAGDLRARRGLGAGGPHLDPAGGLAGGWAPGLGRRGWGVSRHRRGAV